MDIFKKCAMYLITEKKSSKKIRRRNVIFEANYWKNEQKSAKTGINS